MRLIGLAVVLTHSVFLRRSSAMGGGRRIRDEWSSQCVANGAGNAGEYV
jgi:hypothetical protein